MQYRKRWIETTLDDLSGTRPVVYVGGARQVGKTTLLRHAFPTVPYVSFDSPTEQRRAMDDPRQFIEGVGERIVLDEVQHVPELLRYIKMAVDADRRPGRWLLTGSQQYAMMRGLSESLAGRVGIMHMQPFSVREWHGEPWAAWPAVAHDARDVREKPIGRMWDNVRRGLFPELSAMPKIDCNRWFDSYVQTYLERDLRQQLRVGDLREFERFLRALAIRTGQMMNYTDLSRDVGVAVSTVREWVSVLQAGYQVVLLEPYHRNLGSRLVKSPKVYWGDTGLAAYLLNIRTAEELGRSPFRGPLFENWVVMELFKTLAAESVRPPLWYWRTSNGTEVDVVIEHGNRLWPIEIKAGGTFSEGWVSGIHAFRQMYGTDAAEGTVVNTGEHGRFSQECWLVNARRW